MSRLTRHRILASTATRAMIERLSENVTSGAPEGDISESVEALERARQAYRQGHERMLADEEEASGPRAHADHTGKHIQRITGSRPTRKE